MAAVRRSTGSGSVVALVVSIVVALCAIGAVIWLMQERAMLKNGILANQKDFEQTIGGMFGGKAQVEAGWSLRKQTPDEYGFQYSRESYEDVMAQLGKAAKYDEVWPLMGWESIAVMQDDVASSDVQAETPDQPLLQLRGLLVRYEAKYRELNNSVADLETRLGVAKETLKQTEARLSAVESKHSAEVKRMMGDHRARLADATGEFNKMKEQFDQARQETLDWQRKSDEAQRTWNAQRAGLRGEADAWKSAYEDLTKPVTERALAAVGQILHLNLSNKIVTLPGGRDAGVEPQMRFVVYSENLAGGHVEKGRLEVSKVFDHTALAAIVAEKDLIVAGDPFVGELQWRALYERPERRVLEELAVEMAPPAVEDVAEEVEEPAAPTVEVEELEEAEEVEEPAAPVEEEKEEEFDWGFE